MFMPIPGTVRGRWRSLAFAACLALVAATMLVAAQRAAAAISATPAATTALRAQQALASIRAANPKLAVVKARIIPQDISIAVGTITGH